MLSLLIWWFGISLETFILLRAFSAKLFGTYPFFYTYIFTVWIFDFPLYFLYTHRADAALYNKYYWIAQFVSLMTGYGILLEIFKHVLALYPGAEKLARTAVVAAFALIVSFVTIYAFLAPARSAAETATQRTATGLERDLRAVQAIFLFILLAAIFYYGIRIGRNMKGMVFGYGIYVATSLMALAVRAYPRLPVHAAWNAIQPFCYDVSLFVWLIALWSYAPTPVSAGPRLETDYEAVAATTRAALEATREYLAKGVRS